MPRQALDCLEKYKMWELGLVLAQLENRNFYRWFTMLSLPASKTCHSHPMVSDNVHDTQVFECSRNGQERNHSCLRAYASTAPESFLHCLWWNWVFTVVGPRGRHRIVTIKTALFGASKKRTTVVNTRYIFSMKIRSQARRYTHNFYFYSHNLFSLSCMCYLDPCHMYISSDSHTVIGYFSHWQLFIDMCSL